MNFFNWKNGTNHLSYYYLLHMFLGAGPGGADEIKRHKFFASIDWTKLANKEIAALYKPQIDTSNELDTSNFDDDFKRMSVVDKPCQPPPNHNHSFRGIPS